MWNKDIERIDKAYDSLLSFHHIMISNKTKVKSQQKHWVMLFCNNFKKTFQIVPIKGMTRTDT